MPHEFIPRDDDPETQAGGAGRRPPPVTGVVADVYDDSGVPNKPPRQLMRKRFSIWIWILLALVMGGFIALVMVALSG
jgi:hypothetical protein